MKTILLYRHAKAVSEEVGLEDKARPLHSEGIEAAERMARYIAALPLRIDHIWASPAQRTRHTAEILARTLEPAPPITWQPKLYLASAGDMLALLQTVEDSCQTIALVGHNPGLHMLSVRLAGEGNSGLIDTLMLKFPTAALAVLQCDVPHWRDIAPYRATLTHFTYPKLLAG